MQIISQTIKQTSDKEKEVLQVTFEDDYVVKDNMPDVLEVVYESGQARIEELRKVGENVWITGKVEFEILYKGDRGYCNLEKVTDAIPFQEKVLMEKMEDDDQVTAVAGIDDMTVGIINSRKLSVRGIINLEIRAGKVSEDKVAGKIQEDNVEQKIENRELLCLEELVHDKICGRKEFLLPKNKANIGRLVFEIADVRNLSCEIVGSKLNISGNIHLNAGYYGEDNNLECCEFVEDFSENMDLKGDYSGMLLWEKITAGDYHVEIGNDYDGEPRQLEMDYSLDVEARIWSNCKMPLLKDMYSVEENLEATYKQLDNMHFLLKNDSKVRVSEQFQRMDSATPALMICGSRASVTVESVRYEDSGIRVNGVVCVKALLLKGDDSCPLESLNNQIGFEQWIEVPGIDSSTRCDVHAFVDQIQVNLMDNSEYEVRGVVNVNVFAYRQEKINVIVGIEQRDKEEVEEKENYGIIGYIVQPNESLWDIAKRYRITVNGLLEYNELDPEKVNAGDKIIIAKPIKI